MRSFGSLISDWLDFAMRFRLSFQSCIETQATYQEGIVLSRCPASTQLSFVADTFHRSIIPPPFDFKLEVSFT